MSYKLSQLSPHASTRIIRMRPPNQDPWSTRASRDSGYLQSWSSDFYLDEGWARRTNWAALLGLGLSLAVSAGFWAGVGWLVAHLWK